MKSAGVLALALCVLFVHTGNYWSATWLSKWAFMFWAASIGFSWWAAKRTSFFHFPLMAYAFTSLIYIAAGPQNPYAVFFDPVTVVALQKNAFFGLAEITVIIGAFSLMAREKGLQVGAHLGLIAVWLIGTVSILSLQRPPDNGLWFGNPSMGAGLLACLVPFVWPNHVQLIEHKDRKWVSTLFVISWAITLVMIYRTRTSVPWGVLGVVTSAYLLAMSPKKVFAFSISAILAACMIPLGQRLLGTEFWDQNKRFEIWKMGWDWFWLHGSPSVGMGYSTTQVLLPIEQMITGHFNGDYFLWFHNDWLQLAIEGGYIGMACVFLSLFRLLWAGKNFPTLFASLAGFITLGLFNYPLRMPIHCFCLVIVAGAIEALSVEAGARDRLKVLNKGLDGCLIVARDLRAQLANLGVKVPKTL